MSKKVYSHSRLSTFEQCPLKYEYQYIKKIKPEVEETIESHIGHCINETFEWLYTLVMQNKIPNLDETVMHYNNLWQEKYKPGFLVVKNHLTPESYFNMGVKFIIDYYLKHQPFKDGTLEVEKRILIDLDEEHQLKGFIDRLALNPATNEIEIHDYKTGNSFPSQEKADADRQLALYAIAIKELFGKDKNVCLVWHHLAHNHKLCSRRTNQELENLKKDILALIYQIEATNHFHPYISRLCDWCEYRSICSAWKEEK